MMLIWTILTAGWINSFSAGININQSYFSDAWQGSDAGAISWTAVMDLGIKKALSRKSELSNELSMAFGQTYTQDTETKKWKPPVKSSDKLEDELVFKLTMGWPVDPFASARALTQFYDNDNKYYFNPITLTQSLGAARAIYAPNDSNSITSRIGISFKELADRADTSKMPIDGGIEFVTSANLKLSSNMMYIGKLRVFKALYAFNPPQNDNWKAPDINFEHTLQISVTKLIKIQIYAQWLYDRDQIDRVQFRENLALSIGYSL